MRRCSNCNRQLGKKSKFCRHCGIKIKQDDFDFGDITGEVLQLDAETITEIMSLKYDDIDRYNIEMTSNIIDLHISESEVEFGTPVLKIQLEIADKAIDSCIANGYEFLEFITGKGESVLYAKLQQLLEEHPQVKKTELETGKIIAYF